jgi:hypothetical protein
VLIEQLQAKTSELAGQVTTLTATNKELETKAQRADTYKTAIQGIVDAGKERLDPAVQKAMEGLPLEAKFRMVQALTAGGAPPADPPPVDPGAPQPPAPVAQPAPGAPPPAVPPATADPPPVVPPVVPPPRADSIGGGYEKELSELRASGNYNSKTLGELNKRYRGKQ